MDNDNDFTFCKVDLPSDKESLEGQIVQNVGGISIRENFTDQADSLLWKGNSLEKTSYKEGVVGSLSFNVIDTPPSKPVLSKQAVPPPDKNSGKGLKEQTATTKGPKVRAKVPFEKGYSQVDWLKLTRTHPDLAGLKGASSKRLISIDEVKQHKREDSIWTVLKGCVYNITPYLKFHPGGVDMLMKAAGKDCTLLFNKYHAWVNDEFLLEKCLVGALDESR